jgi:hypothetical protein
MFLLTNFCGKFLDEASCETGLKIGAESMTINK